MFSTKNISEGWDGKIKGTQQTIGLHVYMIKGSNEKGEKILKGSLILI